MARENMMAWIKRNYGITYTQWKRRNTESRAADYSMIQKGKDLPTTK